MSESSNLHSKLYRQHGREVVVGLRRLEKTERKLARWINHRHFNIRCARSDVMPNNIRLKSSVRGETSDKILRKTERKLLEVRIRQCTYTIDKLKGERSEARSKLESYLPAPLWTEVEMFTEHAHRQTFEETKTKQRGKFEKLQASKDKPHCTNEELQKLLEIKERWVVNLSDITLKPAAESLLRKGLNYAVTPSKLPVDEIITATEEACKQLPPGKADLLRSDVTRTIKNTKPLKCNLSLEERKALQELKANDNIKILPADKGRASVVLNTADYNSKIQDLLKDTNTYKILKKDPTQVHKRQLTNILKEWKDQGRISDNLYHQLYPTSEMPPRFYGLPKIHKQGTPLRPIVSSIGSITYNVARHIANILSPMVGKNGHSIKNSTEFAKKIQNMEIPPGRHMISYDVSALFTSIPTKKAVDVIRNKIKEDHEFQIRSELSSEQILQLLEFCLDTTYFKINNRFYQQTHGAAMGSPVSPIVANLYMENFEINAIRLAERKPHVWLRYVDDTFVILHEYDTENFTKHINSLDSDIKFTVEEESDGKLPFLDTLVILNSDGSLKTQVYRKKTHTDQYLNWDSNHHLEHKRSVVRTLLHRAECIVSAEEDRKEEITHVKQALRANGYKEWSLKLPNKKHTPEKNKTKKRTSTRPVGLPYIKGTSEKLQRLFNQQGVTIYHKPLNTIRSMLVRPKDPVPKENQCGLIYKITCDDCNHNYIGETARPLGVRFKEHTSRQNTNSPLKDHLMECGHTCTLESAKILDKEENWFRRRVKEALHIRRERPTLNRDPGLELAPVYSQLLSRDQSWSRDSQSHVISH